MVSSRDCRYSRLACSDAPRSLQHAWQLRRERDFKVAESRCLALYRGGKLPVPINCKAGLVRCLLGGETRTLGVPWDRCRCRD